MKRTILFTGDRGFIAGYVIPRLLDKGHKVIGLDNDWKYGEIEKSFDNHENYIHYKGDAKDVKLLTKLIETHKCDLFIMGAAIIGGISLFHTLPYFLLAENERITASAFDAAIEMYNKGILKKVVVISSSMVYESATQFPSPEGHQLECAPPLSSYGFQKLSTEYFAKAAFDEYKVPYIIVRPFNCAGTGEYRALCDAEIMSGNVKLAMSHVIPDLIQKIQKGQDPLHILGSGDQVRHYTYGGDLADGIVSASLSDYECEDFNLSTPNGHTVLELAEEIWKRLKPGKEFAYVSDEPFKYDVQKRIPETSKAKELLGYEATTSLDKILDEVIPWVTEMVEIGKI
jgi:UDP-glucose 4-epimerase